MKKPKMLWAMLLMTMALTFAGCEKDPEPAPAGDTPQSEEPQTPASIDLSNTSWNCKLENDYNYMGVTMHIVYQSFIDFYDNADGEEYVRIVVTIPAFPAYGEQVNEQVVPFTCTYDGNEVTFHYSYYFQEELYEYDNKGVYDPEAKTLTVDMNDADTEEMLGTDVAVYHRIY